MASLPSLPGLGTQRQFGALRSGSLSYTQLLDMQQLMKASQQHHESFFDKVKHGSGHGLAWTFNKIMRPGWASNSAIAAALDHKDIGHAYLQGLEGKSQIGVGEILKEHGVLKHHNTLRGIAGFIGDLNTDPTVLLSIIAAPETGGASLALRFGLKGAGEKLAVGSVHAISALEKMPKGELRAVLAESRSAYHAFKSEPGFELRKVAARKQGQVARTLIRGSKIPAKLQTEYHAVGQAAHAEFRKTATHRLQGAFKVPFGPAVKLTPQRLGPKAPNLGRIAEKGGVLGKIPLASQTAGLLGKAFVDDFGEPGIHAVRMGTKHASERIADDYLKLIEEHAGRPGRALKPDEMFDALSWAEKQGKKLFRVGTREIDRGHLGRAPLSAEQKKFIEGWHSVSERMRIDERGAGIKYTPTEGIYVPHIRMSNGRPLHSGRNMLSTRGFQYDRINKRQTVEDLRKLNEGGKFKELETNPLTLMAMRARRSAGKQADQAAVGVFLKAYGVPSLIKDKARLAELDQREQKLLGLRQLREQRKLAANIELHMKTRARESSKDKALRTMEARTKAKILELQQKSRDFKHSDPKIEKLQKARYDALVRKHSAELPKRMAAFSAQHDARTEKLLEPHHATVARQERLLQSTQNRLNRIPAMRDKALTANPAAKDMAVLDAEVKALGGIKHALPHAVHEAIKRHERAINDQEFVTAFDQQFDKWMGRWKVGVTSVNPGYMVRNTLTDMWNMYVSGVPLAAGPVYFGKALRLIRQAAKGDASAKRLLDEMNDHGILTGLFQGDVQQKGKALRHGTYHKGRLKNPAGLYIQFAGDVNRIRENAGRIAHYLYRREHERMDIAGAAAQVRLAHFDYGDLTELEQRRFKKIAPFYTWSRKNIPFQIRQLASRPGRVAAFPKLANEMESASGDTSGDTVPDWLNNAGAFRIPGGAYIAPQLGITDLLRAQHPLDFGRSVLSPAFSYPIAVLTGVNSQGLPIQGSHPQNPIRDSLFGVDLKPLLNLAGAKQTSRKVNGEIVTGTGINPWVSEALSALPLTNFIFNQGANIKQAQRRVNNSAAIGYALGVPPYRPDAQGELAGASADFTAQMKQMLTALRDQGQLPPSMPSMSPFSMLMQSALQRSIQRGG